MRKYGKDFNAIAEAMGSKTPNQLNSFYVHYRKRYQLDSIVDKFDDQHIKVVEITDDEDDDVSILEYHFFYFL